MNTMKKLTAAAALGFAVGFIVAVLLMGKRDGYATAGLIGWLVLMVLFLATVGAGLAMVPGWLKEREQRAQLDKAERMGRVYDALDGERVQKRAARRPAQEQSEGGPGPTMCYVVGGERSEARVWEDLARWLRIGQ